MFNTDTGPTTNKLYSNNLKNTLSLLCKTKTPVSQTSILQQENTLCDTWSLRNLNAGCVWIFGNKLVIGAFLLLKASMVTMRMSSLIFRGISVVVSDWYLNNYKP